MFVKQLYTSCLAEAAYYVESEGLAAIVDPIREIEPYIELAKSRGATIKYVFETHFHADFVSGHIDLARQTGAQIIFGPLAETSYPVYNAKDGEEFRIGNLTMRTIHTPGHTPESTCYLLLDKNYQEYCIFTGDTLFVGDVGRPDLLDGKMSSEELAGMLYDSLHNKIKKLPDEVLVYPAHGPGSACGKNIGKETWSTIGDQKKMNYALGNMPRHEFIRTLVDGLLPPPAYFFEDARINKEGYSAIDAVIKKNNRGLSPEEFRSEIDGGAVILDTRRGADFDQGFIDKSINIGLEGMYAIWVGTILNINDRIVLVCYSGKEEEAIRRLARVGFENVAGYIENGIDGWKNAGFPIETMKTIEPAQFAERVHSGVSVIDVRNVSETSIGHIRDASLIPLAELRNNFSSISKNEPVYVHCAGGYRSMIACSILRANGFDNVVNVHQGWNKIKDTGVPIVLGSDENMVTK